MTPSRRRPLPAHVKSSWLPFPGGAVAQLGARLDGIEEVVGSNPIGSTNLLKESGSGTGAIHKWQLEQKFRMEHKHSLKVLI
jgi:hypothetical protein